MSAEGWEPDHTNRNGPHMKNTIRNAWIVALADVGSSYLGTAKDYIQATIDSGLAH